jgi:putative SOS response-associated peptidase YedK
VTTEANELLESVPHDRMPVILEGDAREAWLDRGAKSPTALRDLQQLLVARAVDEMESTIVSSEFVNHGIDDERCIEPVAAI